MDVWEVAHAVDWRWQSDVTYVEDVIELVAKLSVFDYLFGINALLSAISFQK